MKKISYRQLFTMSIMILPITGHLLLVAPLLSIARRDAWVAILAALPFGLIYAIILGKLHTLDPEQSFPQMMTKAFGKKLGALLGLIQIALFLYLLLLTFKTVTQFVQIFFLPETSQWVLGIVFYLAILYALKLGIEPVARFSEPVGMLIPFTGMTVGIASLAHKDFSKLFPMFESSPHAFLNAMIMTIALYGELIFVLQFLCGKASEKARPLWIMNCFGVLFVSLTFLGAVTGSIALFGDRISGNSEYPSMAILGVVSLGFIERVDVYGIFTIILGTMIRVPMYHFVIERTLDHIKPFKNKFWIRAGIALLICMAAIKIPDNIVFMKIWVTQLYPYSAIISIGLPVMTWLVLLIRNAWQPRLAPS